MRGSFIPAWNWAWNRACTCCLIAASFLLPACSILSDFTHMDSVHVTGVSPEEMFVGLNEVETISLSFSAEMQKASAEEAFSLRCDSASVPGTFTWSNSGQTCIFHPLAPLEMKRSFIISLSSSAEDLYGNSLACSYTRTFHTRKETQSPFVVSVSPAQGLQVTDTRQPLAITFSEAMDEASVLASFSLTPEIEGFFSWSGEKDRIVFKPLKDYTDGTTYTVCLGRDCLDQEGNPLEEERSFQFSLPQSAETRTVSVTSSDGFVLSPVNQSSFLDPALEIEKDASFTVLFSCPVPPEERNSVLTLSPPISSELQWKDERKSCELSFPEFLTWGTVYEITAADRTYRFLVNGRNSRPLTVDRVVYIQDTTASDFVYEDLLFSHNYDFPSSPAAAFDLYISHGPGRSVLLAGLLESFSLAISNGCIEVEQYRVESFPSETETVFRIHCCVEDILRAGTVTIVIGEELQDDKQNRLPEKYFLQVNKQ